MNRDQEAKYRGHWNEEVRTLGRMMMGQRGSRARRVVERVYTCAHCGFRYRGRGGNALAKVAIARGVMMTHVREKHPELLNG